MTRQNWYPCYVCGAEHRNPMSSSICSSCGKAKRAERQEAERIAALPSTRWKNLCNVPERARDKYMAMEDDFSPSTVLDFMLAMYPEPDELVDLKVDFVDPVELSPGTYEASIAQVEDGGDGQFRIKLDAKSIRKLG